jgi:hypothetical protein
MFNLTISIPFQKKTAEPHLLELNDTVANNSRFPHPPQSKFLAAGGVSWVLGITGPIAQRPPLSPQQFRQLGDVGCDAPRFTFRKCGNPKRREPSNAWGGPRQAPETQNDDALPPAGSQVDRRCGDNYSAAVKIICYWGEGMATFVLVHGAWHGAWCWRRVARLLTRAGHEVFTPTLTGLCERSHLLTPTVDLDTHQCTPQPIKSFFQKLPLTGARERIAKKTYIRATAFPTPYFDAGLASARGKVGALMRCRAATTSCSTCRTG